MFTKLIFCLTFFAIFLAASQTSSMQESTPLDSVLSEQASQDSDQPLSQAPQPTHNDLEKAETVVVETSECNDCPQ